MNLLPIERLPSDAKLPNKFLEVTTGRRNLSICYERSYFLRDRRRFLGVLLGCGRRFERRLLCKELADHDLMDQLTKNEDVPKRRREATRRKMS